MADTTEEKPKKKRVNSKAKGSGFESHICKILTETLPPMHFRRSQSSGAILGGRNQRFLHHYSNEAASMFVGDICSTNEEDVFRQHGWKFRFSLECKFYKDVDNLEQLFANTKIKGWFEQALTDAAKVNKEPLLIFKFNRTETFCAVNEFTIKSLPSKISSKINLVYNDINGSPRSMTIFLLKEALLDTDWWKIKEVTE